MKLDYALPGTLTEVLLRFRESDKTAAICGNERMTYRQLVDDAVRFALVLREEGVGHGDIVAVNLGRNLNHIRAIAGIAFAGAGRMALNGAWPEKQRSLVLSAYAPALYLDDAKVSEIMRRARYLETADYEGLAPVSEDDICQIIFSSGSTGTPKGAVNTHGMVMTDTLDCVRTIGAEDSVNPFRVMLLDGNPSFILTSAVLMHTLCWEKTLVFAREADLQSPSELAACIKSAGVNTVMLTPSRFVQNMQDASYADAMRQVEYILFAGEPFGGRAARLAEAMPGCSVFIIYGSSEVLMTALCEYQPGEEVLFRAPVGGAGIYLLDEAGNETGPGRVGELCVGGVMGGHGGYFRRPELTAEKYLPHPVYGRLFHTGDLAERAPEGRIRILGRRDRMIKVHGLRIEPAAVEKAIESFPGIGRAAVTAEKRGEDTEYLLAFYTLGKPGKSALDEAALRRFLADRLPYYMVPALFKELERMPMNANGKLDYRSLPPVIAEDTAYESPKNERERLLCECFSTALNCKEPIGTGDSFFALGGDSIRGMLLISLLREKNLELRLPWLFTAPTVRQLAPLLRESVPDTGERQEAGPLIELTGEEKAILVDKFGTECVQAVYPLLYDAKTRFLQGSGHILPYFRFIRGDCRPEEIKNSLQELHRLPYHDAEIVADAADALRKTGLAFFYTDLRALQDRGRIQESGLSTSQENYLKTLRRLDTEKGFDREGEVMLRAGLVRMKEDLFVLYVLWSHILLDGTGISAVARDITGGGELTDDSAAYGSFMRSLIQKDKAGASLYYDRLLKGFSGFTGFDIREPEETAGLTFSFVSVGAAMRDKIDDFCQKRRITYAGFFCHTLGETICQWMGRDAACLFTWSNLREAASRESAALTGSFINRIPCVYKRGQSSEELQEQLLRSAEHAFLERDELPGQELFAGKAVVSLNLSNYYGEEARDPDNLNTRGSFILEALHSLDAGSFRNSFEILLEYVEGAIVLCLICDDRIMDQHSARKILAIWLGKMKEQL